MVFHPVSGLLRAGLFFALAGLAGCVSTSPGSGSPGTFLYVNDLRCSDTDGFSAVGHLASLNSLEGVAFHSPDRGRTWRRSAIEGGAAGISLSLLELPDGRRFIAGYQGGSSLLSQIGKTYNLGPGRWWSSADGQKSWQLATPLLPWPEGRGYGQKVPHLLAMRDGSVLAIAQASAAVVALRSVDGGSSWTRTPLPQMELLLSTVANDKGQIALSGRGGWGVLSTPRDFAVWSRDAGASWTVDPLPLALSFYLTPDGSLIGFNHDQRKYGGTLLYRAAGIGEKWQQAARFSGPGQVMSMAGTRGGRVVALTEYGYVLISDDDGSTWQNRGQTAAIARSLLLRRPMLFLDGGIVVALAGNGTIIRSTDRGETWRTVATSGPKKGTAELCADGNGTIVAMGNWTVLRSTDWGATWEAGRFAD